MTINNIPSQNLRSRDEQAQRAPGGTLIQDHHVSTRYHIRRKISFYDTRPQYTRLWVKWIPYRPAMQTRLGTD